MTQIVLVVLAGAVAFATGWALGRSSGTRHAADSDGEEAARGVTPADVLDGHPTGIVIADRAGRVEYRNAAARRLTGTHSGVLIDEAIERHLALGRSGSARDRTIEFYGPPKLVFHISAKPLPQGRSVAFIEDISERRRVEQSRTDFVANISHELKTPVGALSVLAETLVDETDLDTIARIVQRMLAESDRASRTIDDLMELSRIEVGAERSVETVRISDVIRGGVDRATELAAQRAITISALSAVEGSATSSDALVVRGDRRQLVSAVGNLVENAVKFSEHGSTVHVRARRSGDWVDLTVSDQGVGIPQRDLDRVFERFYRVDRARSRSTGGTGLGLSIVRHVASNHGGDVSVTSVEGEGSTFVLRLPIGVDISSHVSGTKDAKTNDEGAA
jgi:two-component system, OmpR family, sensor histidine kinase SenX3